MNDEHADREIGGFYREHLKRELARPEVAHEKKEFIARCFEERPVAALSPAAFAPALSLVALFIVLVFLQQPMVPTKSLESVPEGAYTLSESVVVKRITSRMGSTLVYQKSYQETPITIVWVFANK